MHPTIWKASGHVDAFNDPLIDNRDSKKRYRADVLIEDQLAKYDDKINKEVAKAAKKFGEAFDEAQFRSTNARVLEHQAKRDALHERFAKALNDNDLNELRQIILDEEIVCPISGTKNWTEVRQFNLMFTTEMGSTADGSMKIYLRPETAQGIFVNYLNVQKTGRMKYLSVLLRLVRHSVTKSLPVSLSSVCVSLNKWRCSSLLNRVPSLIGLKPGRKPV